MRLIRFGESGREEPGVILPDGRRIDASGEFIDYDEGFFAMGGLESLAEWVAQGCPGGAEKLDYEVELAVVIGCTASNLTELEASDCIAGYSVFCDYSERAFQKEMGGQWTKGKSADSFAPMGPCLVTPDEVADPHGLRLWCKVNTETRQNGWTGDMIFKIPFLISYISRFMTLLPGDVISTGTPGGVGMGMSPPKYLQPGDSVECGIEGLGELRQRVVPG
jgi:2,4-diketo-3-deoxy-L-fuconate hydrolase